MAETIIEIKIHKYFGKNCLKGIDLDIKKGEVVVIIGPFQTGKSTFMKPEFALKVWILQIRITTFSNA